MPRKVKNMTKKPVSVRARGGNAINLSPRDSKARVNRMHEIAELNEILMKARKKPEEKKPKKKRKK